MKRTQIQLEEPTYALLRRKAFARSLSISALIREVLHEYLAITEQRRLRIVDFTFIGSGSRDDGDLSPVSERHDEALARQILD